MNFFSLKTQFIKYLKDNDKLSNVEISYNPLDKNYEINSDTSSNDIPVDVSIFEHIDDFKEFVDKKYGKDISDVSFDMSKINAILDDQFEDNETISPFDAENADNKNDKTDETTTDIDKQSQFATNPIIKSDDSNISEDDKFVIDFMNDILTDKNMINIIDSDSDETYSKDELVDFFAAISSLDDEKDNLSINDLVTSFDKFSSNEFASVDDILKNKELDELNEDLTSDKEIEDDNSNTRESSSSSAPSSSGGGGGGGSFSSGGSTSSNVATSNQNESKNKNPSEMTLEQLNEALPDAQEKLDANNEKLNSIINGTDGTVKTNQEKLDNSYQKYLDMIESVEKENETFSKDISLKNDEIIAQENLITEKDISISQKNQEMEVCNSNITSIDASIKLLSVTIDSIQIHSNPSDQDNAAAQSQISNIKNQINELEQKKKNEENKLVQLSKDKATIETEKNEAQDKLNVLNEELTVLQEKLEEAHPEVKEYRQEYENLKNEVTTAKNNQISEAKKAVQESQAYLNNINAQISVKKTEEDSNKILRDAGILKDQYNEEKGQKIVEAALKTARRRNSSGLCLAGVSDTLNDALGIRLCARVSSAYQALELLRGNAEGYEGFKEHFKEVDGYTRLDLKNLPAGAVVVWDQSIGPHGHISVADGQGHEISDHFQNQVEWGGNFNVFIPI